MQSVSVQHSAYPVLNAPEIGALKTYFPGSTIYHCGFHREQAWERWVHDKKCSLSAEDAELLLKDLCTYAWMASTDSSAKEPQDYHSNRLLNLCKAQTYRRMNTHLPDLALHGSTCLR